MVERKERRFAAKLTEQDKAALQIVKRAGWVGLQDGEPFLESNHQIGAYRFKRLRALGYLVPNGDAMLMFGVESQTFKVVEIDGARN